MMYDGQNCSPPSSSIAWFHQLHLISKYFRMKNESECFSGSLCITRCGPLFLKIIFLSSNDIKELWVKGFCSQLEGNIVEGFNFFAFLPTMGRFATYSRSVKIYVEVWPTRRARNYSFFSGLDCEQLHGTRTRIERNPYAILISGSLVRANISRFIKRLFSRSTSEQPTQCRILPRWIFRRRLSWCSGSRVCRIIQWNSIIV